VKDRWLLVLALALLGIGAAGLAFVYTANAWGPALRGPRDGGPYASLGERIYLTGRDASGDAIPRSGLPVSEDFLMMGGGGCASCHGPDGRGGTIGMMQGSVTTPDIRYDALENEGFDEEAIAEAIVDGRDEGGEQLDALMPRWKMSDTEVSAVIEYLKELSDR